MSKLEDLLCGSDIIMEDNSICDSIIPKQIYHLKEWTSEIDYTLYIFVGSKEYFNQMIIKHEINNSADDIIELLRNIEETDEIDDAELDILGMLYEISDHEYLKGRLGIGEKKTYIYQFIDRSDRIKDIKTKISIGLQKDNSQHLQYLWANTCYREPGTDNIDSEYPQQLGFVYRYEMSKPILLKYIAELERKPEQDDPMIKMELDRLYKLADEITRITAKSAMDKPVKKTKLDEKTGKAKVRKNARPKKVAELPKEGETKKTRRKAVMPSEFYNEYNIIMTQRNMINPYSQNPFNIENLVTNLAVEKLRNIFIVEGGTKSKLYRYYDLNNMILQDYHINNEYTLNVVFLNDYVKILTTQLTSKINSANEDERKQANAILNGYIIRYWGESNTSTRAENLLITNYVKNIALPEKTINEYKNLVEYVEKDQTYHSFVDGITYDNALNNINQCSYTGVVIKVDSHIDRIPIVDVEKLFQILKLSDRVPFAKLNFNKISIIRLYTGDNMPTKENVIKWADEIIEKGLLYKIRLSSPDIADDKAHYATLNIYPDGHYDIKCKWDNVPGQEITNTDIRELLELVSEIIDYINTVDYHFKKQSAEIKYTKISNPDIDFMDKSFSNTKFIDINGNLMIDIGRVIDYGKLNSFSICFDTFLNVIPTDIILFRNPETGMDEVKRTEEDTSNALHAIYKKVSLYETLDEREQYLYGIMKEHGTNIDIKLLTKAIETFSIKNKTKYTLGENDTWEKVAKRIIERLKILNVRGGITTYSQYNLKYKMYQVSFTGANNINDFVEAINFYIRMMELYRLFMYSAEFKEINNSVVETITACFKNRNDKQFTQILQKMLGIGIIGKTTKEIEAIDTDLEEHKQDLITANEEDKETLNAAIETLEQAKKELLEKEAEEAEEEENIPQPVTFRTIRTDPLSRLKEADNEIWGGTNTARGCQKGKQPMVISDAKRDELDNTYKTNLTKPLDIDKKNNYTNALAKLSNKYGASYRGNFYFCPVAFCYQCEKPFASIAEAKAHEHPNHLYIAASNKAGTEAEHPYISQYTGKYAPQSYCVACCAKSNKGPDKLRQCANQGKTKISKTGKTVKKTTVETPTSIKYVFTADKNDMAKGRYAFLPSKMHSLLNSVSTGTPTNCTTKTGEYSSGEILNGFNCYLRKGVGGASVNDAFLQAIADVIGSNTDIIRKMLIDKLTPELFETLHNGVLPIVFGAEDDTLPITSLPSPSGFDDSKPYQSKPLEIKKEQFLQPIRKSSSKPKPTFTTGKPESYEYEDISESTESDEDISKAIEASLEQSIEDIPLNIKRKPKTTITPKEFLLSVQDLYSSGEEMEDEGTVSDQSAGGSFQSAYEQFKIFLKVGMLDENMIWDYVSKEGILTPKGFNLVLVETDKKFQDYTVICPDGYDIDSMTSLEKPTVIIMKYGSQQGGKQSQYEPIYKVKLIYSEIEEEKILAPHNALSYQLITMMQKCMPVDDPIAYKQQLKLKKLAFGITEDMLPSTLAKKIFEDSITHQILDSYGNTFYFIVKIVDEDNKGYSIMLPVEPSIKFSKIPIISNDDDIPQLPYIDTINILASLNTIINQYIADKNIKNPEKINYAPLVNIVDLYDGKTVIKGILLTNGGVIYTDPLDYTTISNKNEQNIINAYNPTDPEDPEGISFVSQAGTSPARITTSIPHQLAVASINTIYVSDFLSNISLVDQTINDPDGFLVTVIDPMILEFPPLAVVGFDFAHVGIVQGNLVIRRIRQIYDSTLTDQFNVEQSLPIKELVSDERVLKANKSIFQDESYHRIRYEFANYLQENGELHKEISDIIESADKTADKRTKIYEKVKMILEDITIVRDISDDEIIKYKMPLIRTYCRSKTECAEDFHCERDPEENICKVLLNKVNFLDLINNENKPKKEWTKLKNTLIQFSHLLTDELIRSGNFQYELLNNQVDNFPKDVTIIREDEKVLDDTDNKKTFKKKIDRVYRKGPDYYENLELHPGMMGLPLTKEETVKTRGKMFKSFTGVWKTLVDYNTKIRYVMESKSDNKINDTTFKWIYDAINQKLIRSTNGNESIGEIKDLKDVMFAFITGRSPKDDDHSIVVGPLVTGEEGEENINEYNKNVDNPLTSSKYPDNPDESTNKKPWYDYYDRAMYLKEKDPDSGISLKTFATSYLYPYVYDVTKLDLAILSRLYDVKFIIMNGLSRYQEDNDLFECIGNTNSTSPWYIILFTKATKETYNIVVQLGQHIDRTNSNEALIFLDPDTDKDILDRYSDVPTVPRTLMDKWKNVCISDNKEQVDPIEDILTAVVPDELIYRKEEEVVVIAKEPEKPKKTLKKKTEISAKPEKELVKKIEPDLLKSMKKPEAVPFTKITLKKKSMPEPIISGKETEEMVFKKLTIQPKKPNISDILVDEIKKSIFKPPAKLEAKLAEIAEPSITAIKKPTPPTGKLTLKKRSDESKFGQEELLKPQISMIPIDVVVVEQQPEPKTQLFGKEPKKPKLKFTPKKSASPKQPAPEPEPEFIPEPIPEPEQPEPEFIPEFIEPEQPEPEQPIPEPISEPIPEPIPESIPESIPEFIPEYIVESIPEPTTEPKKVAKKIPKKVAKNIAKKVAKRGIQK